jgi:hypothetical protein
VKRLAHRIVLAVSSASRRLVAKAGNQRLVGGIPKVQVDPMKRSIELDEELAAEVDKAATLVGEKPATIIRLAIRAGLPTVTDRFQGPRPEGYFADAYRDYPQERLERGAAFAKAKIGPDR